MQAAEESADEARQLGDELVRLRQRGLTGAYRRRPPLQLPLLEQLAAVAVSAPTTDPTTRLRLYLDARLTAWSGGGNQVETQFVRRLYQDDAGRWPGPAGPRGLLRAARKAEGIHDEDQFRRLQRVHLDVFADYLLNTRADPVASEAPAQPAVLAADAVAEPPLPRARSRGRGRRPAVVAAGLLLVAAVAVAVIVGLSRNTHRQGNAGRGSGTPAGSSSGTSPQVFFRFDNLGSTVQGGSTIFVYPGTSTSAADRKPDGEYTVGQEVPAICVTTGRRVTSDPTYHETPKSSDQWVRVGDRSGPVQYATLTYGQLTPDGARLPAC